MVDRVWFWPVVIAASWLVLVVAVHEVSMWRWRRSLVAYRLDTSARTRPAEVAAWLGLLRSLVRAPRWVGLVPAWPLGLEITGTRRGIDRVLVVPRRLWPDVLAATTAALPGARVVELPEYARTRLARCRLAGAARNRARGNLLASERAEEASRYLLAALQPLARGEIVRVQWLLAAARAPRAAFHPDPPLDVRRRLGPRWRGQDPVLHASCRIGVAAGQRQRRRHLFGRVWASVRQLNTPGAVLRRRWWLPSWVVSLQLRARRVPLARWPLTLTNHEIAGLLGLVTGPTGAPGVPASVARSLPPSPAMPRTGVIVGGSNYPGTDLLLRLRREDRLRHVWTVGPTGVGKSTLLANMITQDTRAGDGVVVIDARGDLAADVLDHIPEDRHADVVVIDPSASGSVVGFNPLRSGPREQAAGFVFHVLHSIYALSWGPRTADLLRASLLTLASTSASDGSAFTVCEVPELLTNPGFRRIVTRQALPHGLGSFWRWYDALSNPERVHVIGPVLNKLRPFVLSTPLRLVLGQSVGVDLHHAMATRKIVIVTLKRGLLGAEPAMLLGSLAMASVWQATLTRAGQPQSARRPCWLYVDEFHDIVRLPIDLADMLAQARGLGLGLTLAHQYLSQLAAPLRAAVLSTARTQIVFQPDYNDARELAHRFGPLTADDLMGLGVFEIALRPCLHGSTRPPVTGTTFPLPTAAHTNGPLLAEASRDRYGLPRAEIDTQLAARVTAPAAGSRSNRIPTPRTDHDRQR